MDTLTLTLADVAEQVVLDRRYLHMHPEVRFQEHATARFVAERLRAHGIAVSTGVAGTGVVGLLRGDLAAAGQGKTVLLRADMDALPIEEANDVPYRSTVPGRMHACGHDGHTAILLGAARVLAERRDRLAGTVKFAFQPAEEGSGGAIGMIEAGVLANPPVDAVFGLHLAQWAPVGQVVARSGPVMAGPSRLEIDIRGKGGHAAMPHLCVDTLLVASHVVVALQSIVAREVKPTDTAVVTIGMAHAGTAPNVIAETAELRGTIRAFDEAQRQMIVRRVEEIVAGVAGALGAEAVTRVIKGPPPVVNDPAMAELVRGVVRDVLGPAGLHPGEQIMAGDDVAEMLARVPGCYFCVGTRNEARGLIYDHHHPRFDIDEAALPTGVALLVGVAERFLNG